jgi:16S rRNA C967 or C1407 C5-methylase (RsmB/RsmF family)
VGALGGGDHDDGEGAAAGAGAGAGAAADAAAAASVGGCRAPPVVPPHLVLDSLVENLFRKRLAQGSRGVPPPFRPRLPAIEGTAARLLLSPPAAVEAPAAAAAVADASTSAAAARIWDVLGLQPPLCDDVESLASVGTPHDGAWTRPRSPLGVDPCAGGDSALRASSSVGAGNAGDGQSSGDEADGGGGSSGGERATRRKRPRLQGASGVGGGGGAHASHPPAPPPLPAGAPSPAARALLAALAAAPPREYDRVLVDAQCTHDGSPRHVAKAAAKAAAAAAGAAAARGGGRSESESAHPAARAGRRGTGLAACAGAINGGGGGGADVAALDDDDDNDDSADVDVAADGDDGGDDDGDGGGGDGGGGGGAAPTGAALEALQRALLASGFACLKPGGRLVYATCSLQASQNEGVVQWLLAAQPTSQLVPLGLEAEGRAAGAAAAPGGGPPRPAADAAAGGWAAPQWQAWHARSARPPWLPGALPGTARFEPRCSGTSGLFLAAVTKRPARGVAERELAARAVG